MNDCTTKVRAITLPDKEKLADQYKFIKEAVKAYPELYFAKLVVLGEGDSEEIILPKIWNAKMVMLIQAEYQLSLWVVDM